MFSQGLNCALSPCDVARYTAKQCPDTIQQMFRQAEAQAKLDNMKLFENPQACADKLVFELFTRRLLDSGSIYTYLNLILPMTGEYGILITKQMYKESFIDPQFVQALRGKRLKCKIDIRDTAQMPAELERQLSVFSDPARSGERQSIIE